MEGRSVFIIIFPKFQRNAFQDEFEDYHDGFWTGDSFDLKLDRAKLYNTRAKADSDFFLLMTRKPDLIGRVEVASYINYSPKVSEEDQ